MINLRNQAIIYQISKEEKRNIQHTDNRKKNLSHIYDRREKSYT